MDRRRARLLALGASTLVAGALFAAAWPHIWDRKREGLRFHRLEPPVGGIAAESPEHAPAEQRSSDPTEPEEWHYYLAEDEADRYFFFRGDNRRVYDPWVYARDAGNLNDVLDWPEHPDEKWTWQTNSLGCREDHELDDPPRNLRVLVAGDSHTCGVCNHDESFANRLEASLALEHGGKSVEVLNAGLGGYSFHNYFGTLLRFQSFKPQVFVVAVFGGNDFVELIGLHCQFTHRPWKSMTPRQQRRRSAALAISDVAMGQGFNALDTFRAWPHEQPAMVRAAIELCVELDGVARRQDSMLILVFIPSPFEFEGPRAQAAAVGTRAALELTDEDLTVNRRMGHDFLEGLREAGLQALDMGPIFAREPDPPYWKFDFHLNLRGHELVAEALLPLVDAGLAAK